MKKTNERGITLISLVITIILLLILATVAISLAVDSDGLFSRAGDAANKWNTSVAEEGTALENLMLIANSIGGTTPPPSTLPDGWNEDSVVATVQEGDRIAPIPDGFVASKVSTEDEISEGLVIYQTNTEVNDTNHENALTSYNQYVWIPVDDINDMVMCQTGGASHTLNETTLQCTTCGESTKLAGKLYWDSDNWEFDADATGQTYPNDDFYRLHEPGDLTSTNYGDASSTGITAIKSILENTTATAYAEIKDDWNELLQTDFENMAKSVAKYGGFYISRYEIGAGGSSVKGQKVLDNSGSTNWWSLFNTLRNNPEIEAPVYSQMVWGSQYDQVMQFIAEETRMDGTGETEFDIKTAVSARHDLSGFKSSGNNISDRVCNIFDLEGNYYEWTLEARSTFGRISRGGRCDNSQSASYRCSFINNYPTDTSGHYSSRRSTVRHDINLRVLKARAKWDCKKFWFFFKYRFKIDMTH